MKRYLGDAVYAESFQTILGTVGVRLTTENGIRTTNTIVLEPEVLTALNAFVREELKRRT